MTHPNAPDTPPKPTWVDGPPSAPSESPWSDDPEGLCECGLDPWLAERLWLDGETAEVHLRREGLRLDDLMLD